MVIPQKLDVPAAFKGLLAMARATAAETSDRIDTLQGLIKRDFNSSFRVSWSHPMGNLAKLQ
ncbi:hypothetical protein [Synechococcus sp. ROS8604]|uniref:hypothetical protein n=1 Tax=Synechococcus sp. ROS8604 TaxID=1442557 RepID=UPI001648B2B4|nr:hypothetical protein [Synechococcus sp. ROS8604]